MSTTTLPAEFDLILNDLDDAVQSARAREYGVESAQNLAGLLRLMVPLLEGQSPDAGGSEAEIPSAAPLDLAAGAQDMANRLYGFLRQRLPEDWCTALFLLNEFAGGGDGVTADDLAHAESLLARLGKEPVLVVGQHSHAGEACLRRSRARRGAALVGPSVMAW